MRELSEQGRKAMKDLGFEKTVPAHKATQLFTVKPPLADKVKKQSKKMLPLPSFAVIEDAQWQ